MALGKTDLGTGIDASAASADNLFSNNKRIVAKETINATFGTVAAEPALAQGYPVGFNKVTSKYAPWIKPAPTVLVITNTGGGGTFGITINGVALANTTFAWNAAALVKETLMQRMGYNVSVTNVSNVITITFDDKRETAVLPTVSADVTQVTGISATAVATAGTASAGTDVIVGFVYPDTVQTDATDDILGVIMTKGEIHYLEPYNLIASGSQAALLIALKDGLIAKGLIVQGLAGIH